MTSTGNSLPKSSERDAASDSLAEAIHSAYDLGSDGMGVQLHTIEAVFQDVSMPNWGISAYISHGSNYIAQPYVIGWLRPDDYLSAPQHLSPHAENGKRIIERMFALYDDLEWPITRDALGMLTGVPSEDNTLPITDAELGVYLAEADARGNLERFRNGVGRSVPEIVGQLEPNTRERYTELDLYNRLIHGGVSFSGELYALATSVALSSTYQERMKQAAIYKLAAMLAITEQVLFDAMASGQPFSANHVPDARGDLHENWQRMFGENMPTFGELYGHAHEVFLRYADRNDPNFAYLFELDTSQYFAV